MSSKNTIPPVKKMIDLSTATETDTKATAYVNKLQKAAARLLKDGNIPAYQMVANDPAFLQKVFLNTDFYTSILGPGPDLIFTAIQTAMARIVTDSIMDTFNNGKAVYPGMWIPEVYNNVALRYLRIFTITNAETNVSTRYLSMTSFDSEEAVKELPEGSFLKFSDYNPNKLWQFASLVRDTIVNQIATNLGKDGVCLALVHGSKETLNERYANELTEVLMDPVLSYMSSTRPSGIEDDIRGFIKAFEVPFMGYMSNLTVLAGVNQHLLSSVFDKSKASVVYILPDDKDDWHKLETTVVKIVYTLNFVQDEKIKEAATVEFNVQDLLDLVETQEVNTKGKANAKIAVKTINRVGKAIYNFMQSLVRYTIDVKILHPTIDYVDE